MRKVRLLGTSAIVASVTMGMSAVPAVAASKTTPPAKPAAVKAVVTTTHAVTSHLIHTAGTTFTISAWVDRGRHGLNKQKVYLMERADAKHKWVKATNVAVNWRITGSPQKGVNGLVTFSGVKALKHTEQYAVLHPRQKVGGTVYGASLSKVITIRP